MSRKRYSLGHECSLYPSHQHIQQNKVQSAIFRENRKKVRLCAENFFVSLFWFHRDNEGKQGPCALLFDFILSSRHSAVVTIAPDHGTITWELDRIMWFAKCTGVVPCLAKFRLILDHVLRPKPSLSRRRQHNYLVYSKTHSFSVYNKTYSISVKSSKILV